MPYISETELSNLHQVIEKKERTIDALVAALKAAIEDMELVADSLPVEKRHEGVSQATHVNHIAGHLAQHAKIARAALEAAQE